MADAPSEQRKKRDAAIRSMDEQIAQRLEQARLSGELQSAESYGKPLAEMAGWDQTPPALRLPFKILKNAQVPPPELDLFARRAALRGQLQHISDDGQRRVLQQRLSELEQLIAMRLEHLARSGSL